MKFILISYSDFFEDESKILNNLFLRGLDKFHIRKPDADEEQIRKLIHEISPEFRNRLVLHSCFNLVAELDLGGIHFNSSIGEEEWSKWIDLKGVTFSCSCHKTDELMNLPRFMDYAFLSPVFDSVSKKSYKSSFPDNERLRHEISEIKNANPRTEVIALGGISPDKISTARSIGFEGVAVIGAVWEPFVLDNDLPGTEKAFEELKKLCLTEVPL